MTSPHVFDLEAYGERIGFEGQFEPTLEVLRTISHRHVRSIPFENLDVLLGREISLDPAALELKLVKARRGGYCFEQNGLMLGILSQIGFQVTPLSGRVRIDSPRNYLPPRTHLFLSVNLDRQEWIFDVGVGGFSLTSPILRHTEGEQTTLHEPRRVISEDGKLFHQAWTGTDWADVYEFTGETMPMIDREVSNWWTSTNPKSKFSQVLACALAGKDGLRYGLLNNRFTVRRGPLLLEQLEVNSADQLLGVLSSKFGLDFPTGTRFGSGNCPWPTV